MLTIDGLAMAGLGPPGGAPAAQGGAPQIEFAALLAAASVPAAAVARGGLAALAEDGAALEATPPLPTPGEAAPPSSSGVTLIDLLNRPESVPPADDSTSPGTPGPDRTSEATVSREDDSTEELLAAALAASVTRMHPPAVVPVPASTPAPVTGAVGAIEGAAPGTTRVADVATASSARAVVPSAQDTDAVEARGTPAATSVDAVDTSALPTSSAADATSGQLAAPAAAPVIVPDASRRGGEADASPPPVALSEGSANADPSPDSVRPRGDASGSEQAGAGSDQPTAAPGRAFASGAAREMTGAGTAQPAAASEDGAPTAGSRGVDAPPATAALTTEPPANLEVGTGQASTVDFRSDSATETVADLEASPNDATQVDEASAFGINRRSEPAPTGGAAVSLAVGSTDRATLQARLADSVLAAARTDASVRLVLNPPELGHLEVRVERHEQGLRVELVAATSDAADLIRQQLPALVSGLEARSVRVDQAEVRQAPQAGSTAFSLGGDARQAGADTSGGGRQWERPDWSEAARLAQQSTAPRSDRPRSGLLDLVA